MKHSIILLLTNILLFSSNTFAETDVCKDTPAGPSCYNVFNISIYNNSPYNCDLSSQSIIYGDLVTGRRVPAYLSPGAHTSFDMVEKGKHGASIRLTYICENNHQITFLSHSNLRPTGKNPMKGTIENILNMRAFVTKSYSSLREKSYMDWTLESNQ
jgi:hypothetical protein